jgi:hypothetical protein
MSGRRKQSGNSATRSYHKKKVHTATNETGEQIEKRRKATVAVERSPQAVKRGRGLGLGARST